ncbi:hypothetical protein J4216_03225 [Candidatus Woesearchaeota archaeon]|nr:hypothetical protein [Candidatus Woesearchaeota archaeon]
MVQLKDSKVRGLLGKGIEKITDQEERSPSLQVHAVRRPAQDGYNDVGVVYVAPWIQVPGTKVQSPHLAIQGSEGKLGNFYCVAEGFDPSNHGSYRSSQGHIAALAASISFMENAYPALIAAKNPVDMMERLTRTTLDGTVQKLKNESMRRADLDLGLLAILPSTKEGEARVAVANMGNTNVLKYDSRTKTFSFMFDRNSIGEQHAYRKGVPIFDNGSAYTSQQSIAIAEDTINQGDELYLLTFIADAWIHPNGPNTPFITGGIGRRDRHLADVRDSETGYVDLTKLRTKHSDMRLGTSIQKMSEGIADATNELDKVYYHGSGVWWDCAAIGVRYMAEVDTPDRTAFYVNEIVKLAGETESLAKLIPAGAGGVKEGAATKLLPAAIQSLVKSESGKLKK